VSLIRRVRSRAVLDRGLADVVAAAHLAYLAFIPVGGFLAWRWSKITWVHLCAVAVGLCSVTLGFDCPLTTWEQMLRRRGGGTPFNGGFVEHYLTGKLYPHGYDLAVQLVIAVCVFVAYAGLLAQQRRRQPTS
jgi:hypothetical protein